MKLLVITIIIFMMCLAFLAGTSNKKKTYEPLKTDINQAKPTQTKINRDKPSQNEIEKSTRLVQGCDEVKLEVNAPGTFKAYMDGSLITDDTSEAFWQIRKMFPDENGIYSESFYKGIAMASYYGKVGDKFKVTLSSGKVFFAVMTDIKQEQHIDENYACKENGSLIEFIVDENLISYEVRTTGSLDCIYPGQILKIEKI